MARKKKDTVTNKMISGLLVVALVVTLVGTLVTLQQVMDLNNQYALLTGLAANNATGDTTIQIAGQTSITNHVASVDFGSGFVNASCTQCIMDSNGQMNQTGACCESFNNVTSGFLIENTGNINVSLNFSCAGSCDAASFIGGTGPAFEMRATPNVFAQQSGETSATDTEQSCYYNTEAGSNWTNNIYMPINTTGIEGLCGNSTNFPLGFAEAADAVVLDINLSIPEDADTSGSKTATFNFTALSTG